MKPTVTYFSQWEPVKSEEEICDPTSWAEYFYCVCKYPNGGKNVIQATEGKMQTACSLNNTRTTDGEFRQGKRTSVKGGE